MSIVKVTLEHTRRLRYCTRGVRAWCQIRGIDFLRLADEGIPAEELEATNDHMAIEAAKLARNSSEEGE